MSNNYPKLSVIYTARNESFYKTDTENKEVTTTSEKDEFYPVVDYPDSDDSDSTESILCRICYQQDSLENLLSPCNCKGSIAYVHRICLEMCLSQKGNATCDLCFYRFDVTYTLKYSLIKSIWVWITHPNTRAHFWLDLFSYVLLNIATIALLGLTWQAMDLFINRELLQNKHDMAAVTVTYGISLFCSILMLFIHFLGSMTFVRFQLFAWHHWWRTSFNIRLKT